MFGWRRFGGLALALALVATAHSQEPKTGQPADKDKPAAAVEPRIPAAVKTLLQERKYPEALQALDAALAAEPTPAAPRDFLAFLKARTLHLAGQFDEAAVAFDQVEADAPEGPYARRARFGRAVALARKGDWQGAEQIYAREAAFLLSSARKQEIADIYLEFARAYFKPANELQAPDYAKALDFFGKALEVGPAPEKKAEIDLQVGQCLQSLGRLDEAAARYAQFAKDYPDSPLEIEARFRLGETQLAQGQLEAARVTWQDLLAVRGASKSPRIAEAAFNLSLTYQMPSPPTDDALNLGVASLEAFIEKYPEHKLASQASLRIAQGYTNRGRFDDGIKSLERFLADARYATTDEVPEARMLLGRSFQLQKKFPEALAAWRDYLVKHPAHQFWSVAQQEIVNTEFLIGEEAKNAKQYDAAKKQWTLFLAQYPLDGRSPLILYEFGRFEFEQTRYAEAIAEWRRLASKYPQTNEASQAQLMVAVTTEEKLGRLSEAIDEYKKVQGPFQGEAQIRLARLTSKTMEIASERVFRGNETPKIVLTTRNIETVTVRAYKVDLETYFRKMHLAAGVESLDIALIDPDVAFEFKVPEYREYRQVRHEVEVPLPTGLLGGVMAVTVTGKTLEATTLVMQSDLDMIVKSSRDELFVFAENMVSGKPWEGVRLLVSDGQKVFAEGVTDANGVFQKSFEELKSANDVRVFAIAGNSTASNVVDLNGVGLSQGLTDRGYIYTDRPAYRSGQVVHVRGVIRAVANDAFKIEAGKKYFVETFDSRNRSIHETEIALSEFGGFHSHFTLPEGAFVGQYRIQVRDDAGKSYQGSFLVQDYQLEPVRIAIESERKVFYRGETIEGKIAVKFYYGAPLVDREVRYQLANGRLMTGRTDEKGELAFKFETRDFRESQTLPLVAMLPERNLQTVANFRLATQGFSLSLSTVRPVYVAGETFELAISAADAEGKPLGQKLKLTVLERTVVEGQVGERAVQEHEIATDDKSGKARHTLRLEKGAQYVLRAEGIDRFQNVVSGQHVVQVSDDKDSVRLRILADKHTFKAGDTAQIKLHWREAPALALVTLQGAKILDYKLVPLQTGSNDLPLPLDAKLAPNFILSVAVMTDARPPADPSEAAGFSRFHVADSPIAVERDLRVDIKIVRANDQGPVRPGEELQVELETTDPQGKPVSAEVSLSMVEQALWDMFGSQVPPIQDVFRGQNREPAVRTTSSVTFSHRPQTKSIDPLLLAEQDRAEAVAEEAERLSRVAGGVEMGDGALNLLVTPRRLVESDRDDASDPVNLGAMAKARRQARLPASRAVAPGKDEEEAPSDEPLPEEEAKQLFDAANAPGGAGGMGGRADKRSGLALRARGRGKGLGKPTADFNGEFDALVESITDSVEPASWDARGFGFENRFVDRNRDGDAFFRYKQAGGRELTVLYGSGAQVNARLGEQMTLAFANKLAQELAEAGAVLLPNRGPQETGYWNPAIVTDAAGKASATIVVPERSTAWKLFAKGVTTETLAGEAESSLVAQQDLFAELKTPLAFTDGDQAEIVATVHNDAVASGDLEVTLKTTIGDKTVEEKKTIQVSKKGLSEVSFNLLLQRPAATNEAAPTARVDVAFELTVSGGGAAATTRKTLPLLPYGMPVFVSAGGTAQSDAAIVVEAPAGLTLAVPQLEITVGPTVERSLLDVVFGPANWRQLENGRLASGLEVATGDLMASLGLQKLFDVSRDAGNPQAASLDVRIRGSLGLLAASQNDDGGWSWTGRGGASNRYVSARVAWALTLARKGGYRVADDMYEKAMAFVAGQIAATGESDLESKCILLVPLALADREDFALANRLHRARQTLSNSALAHLGLAFAYMDRGPAALELLTLLGSRKLDADLARRQSEKGSLPWSYAATETRALYLLALQMAAPADPKNQELADWLIANRSGSRWAPEKATGPAALALCEWFAKTRFDAEHYKLAVVVNDDKIHEFDIDKDAGSQTFVVPSKFLVEGKQRVSFQIVGRGRYTYQATLSGFVPAEKLASTTKDWHVNRIYEPAPREFDGEVIPRGFGVLQGGYTPFRNPLSQLPVGQRGHVTLEMWRANVPSGTPEEQLEYLVLVEPLPCGATVIEQSITGGFERYEISPGAITFFIGNRTHIEPIQFDLHGYLPGQYRAAPSVLQNAYRPGELAVSQSKSLTVLPLGRQSIDEYKLTPQELFELGKRHFAKRGFETAKGLLEDLEKAGTLQAEVHQQSVQMLLDIYLELGPAERIVHYFEIVKERYPATEIPFEKIVKVGAAYDRIGEYERSYLVFRATIEGSFFRESAVAGFLEAQGEFLRSVDVMGRLLAEYPPESYVAAAQYALAQRVYGYAPHAAGDIKLRERKINRVDLIRQALTRLDEFLGSYPEDPAADQAAFSLANALLELKSYREAIAQCGRFEALYPKSDLLDSYWFMTGYCHFALGEHEQALAMCRKVAESTRPDPQGRPREAVNKWQAIYILGQVHHSLGRAIEAIAEYTRVADRFPDAKSAIDYFVRKEISLPEVSTFKPGEAAEVELKFRNIDKCDVKVYRIDLMKFSLLKRNLAGITRINLAGIRPYHEALVELGDGKDFRDRTQKLALPLKEEGAYLVVCRGQELHASGLALVTPLGIEVQEDATSGQVRATIKDRVADRYVSNVHVKVIGSFNQDFMSGETDLRGVSVADGVLGTSTVIARLGDNRYAFFRGTTPLGAVPAPQAAAEKNAEQAGQQPPGKKADEYLLEGLQMQNSAVLKGQEDSLKGMYNRGERKSIQAQEAAP